MRLTQAVWLKLFAPTAATSVAAGLLFWCLAGDVTAALGVFAGAGLAAGATAWRLCGWSARAAAHLRNTALRERDALEAGVFAEVVSEAAALLRDMESREREAATAKAQLEGKLHVRHKQIRQLEAALNCVAEPVIVTDTHGALQYANESATGLLQSLGALSVERGRARSLELSRVPELAGLWEQTRMRSAATNSRSAEFELSVDGKVVPYSGTSTNLWDGETPLGIATVLRDIRVQRKEKARHAEFVSAVCHELKTPMSSIKAFTEMLIDGDVTDPEEQKELLGFVETQVDRLTRLVNNMLNVSRIESGVIEIKREDCGLNELLERALDVVRPAAEEKNVSLVNELSELYLPVHVDRDLFGQAVINLLSNAVKYTPEGGEVRLRSRLDDNRALVEVRDNGMGIPESSLPRIFERFYRVPENTKAASGTGLGLALVHSIVTEILGGRIGVESAVGKGTTFTISLPLGHRSPARKKQETTACAV